MKPMLDAAMQHGNLMYGAASHCIEILNDAHEVGAHNLIKGFYERTKSETQVKFENIQYNPVFHVPVDCEQEKLKKDISFGLRDIADRIDAGLEIPIELKPGTYAFTIKIGKESEIEHQEKTPDVMSVTRSVCK